MTSFKKIAFALLAILWPTLFSCAQTRIMVLSDPHVLVKDLFDPTSDSFIQYYQDEPKSEEYSQDLFETAIANILEAKPDIVLVPGDMTKDGEQKCHEYVAKELQLLMDAGINVYIVPGNHDIENPYAKSYLGSESASVNSVTQSEFKQIYASCGYSSAVKVYEGGLSYMCYPNSELAVICLDSTQPNNGVERYSAGGLSEELLSWAEEAAAEARASGRYVIGMMHHPIVEHFDNQTSLDENHIANATSGYPTLESVQRRLIAAGIQVMFTGHFHVQSIQHANYDEGELYDVLTGSLCCYNSQIRTCNLSPKGCLTISSHTVASSDVLSEEKTRNIITSKGIIATLARKLYATISDIRSSNSIIAMFSSTMNLPNSEAEMIEGMNSYLLDSYTDLVNTLYAGDEDQNDPDTKYAACQQSLDNYLLYVCGGHSTIVSMIKSLIPEYDECLTTTRSILYNYVGDDTNVVADNANTIQLTRDLKGDVNGDNIVDIADLAQLIGILNEKCEDTVGKADVNKDNAIDIKDIKTLVEIMVRF